ncbi:MAG: hypothetical protein ACYDC3_09045 [Candidatus Binataceae bacterium]
MMNTQKLNLTHPRISTCLGTLVIACSFAMMLLAGCSTNAPTPQAAALNHTELTFNLSQCLPIEAHVWRCPAVDRPICDSDYAGGTYTQCIRIGKKGSVFVTGPGGE